MGLWSSTFGDGNSFKESVANVFTQGDGATYSGGNLVTDASAGSDNEVSVAAGTVIDGKTITGNANSTFNDGKVNTDGTVSTRVTGTAPEASSAISTALGVVVDPLSAIPKVLTSLVSWVNGIDPTVDGSIETDGRMVYTRAGEGKKFEYSYNFAGMPYQVETTADGKVVDFLKIVEDANGKREGDDGYDSSTAMTGYARSQANFTNSGDDDGASQVSEYEQNNSSTASSSGGSYSSGDIMDMAEKAGLIKVQADMDAILADPNKFLADRGLKLADLMTQLDVNAEGTSLDPDDPNYKLSEESGYEAVTTGDPNLVGTVTQTEADTYDSELNVLTDKEMVNAVTGEVSEDALVDAEGYTIDVTGASTGVNADGTTNELGIALNDWASVDISKVIDTSTAAGKLLADKLNSEGKDFVDAKTSILFQMKTISAEFKGPNGEPVIPPWAAKLHANTMKSIAFNGLSGTAQTAAMANAIMESVLGVAEKEAVFFQTLTTTNLSNKQESIINKANVLSKIELANLDVRSQAAVTNAKHFMEMDMKNLTNEQQAEVINKQALVQAMLDNTKEINANRLFTAETNNDRDTFYAELNASIEKHNTSELNALARFNAGEINSAAEFNAEMRNSREQFVSTMQYNIDVANAKWRQTVETTNTTLMADAHTADVKAALDLTQEVQNNIWDSADLLLDYIWKTADNDQDRELRLLLGQMQAQAGQSSGGGFLDGLLKLGGAYLGSKSGSDWMTKLLGKVG